MSNQEINRHTVEIVAVTGYTYPLEFDGYQLFINNAKSMRIRSPLAKDVLSTAFREPDVAHPLPYATTSAQRGGLTSTIVSANDRVNAKLGIMPLAVARDPYEITLRTNPTGTYNHGPFIDKQREDRDTLLKQQQTKELAIKHLKAIGRPQSPEDFVTALATKGLEVTEIEVVTALVKYKESPSIEADRLTAKKIGEGKLAFHLKKYIY